MPNKNGRIVALVKERGPISELDLKRALDVNKDETRRAVADLGGMIKPSDEEPFNLFVIPTSQEERDVFAGQGYVAARVRGR